MPVKDGEALPNELVPAAAHLLLDGRFGRDEPPYDERPPGEKVRRAGNGVHSSLSEGLEAFEREERRPPFLLRRQEGEPARPDDVRPERLPPQLDAHAVHDLDPRGRGGGDLLRGASDETAGGPERPRGASAAAAGRGGAHAAPAAAPAGAETTPFDRGGRQAIFDTSGELDGGSLAALGPRFTGSRPSPARRLPRSRAFGRPARSRGRRPP